MLKKEVNIMYMLKKVFKMDFKKMNEIINRCSKKSGKNKFIIFIDMVLCLALYKAGYTDYEFFEFYKYKRKDRKTILTRGKNNDLVKKLNPKEYWDIIDDKVLFNEKFKKLFKLEPPYSIRDYLKLDQNDFNSFKNFIKNKKEIIVKPIKETCGHGVEKINISDYKFSCSISNLFISY